MSGNILYDFLSTFYVGKRNAVKANVIANELRITTRDIRQLREDWNKDLNNDVKILTCNNGFYLPNWDEKDEIKSYADTLEHKALSMLKEVSVVRKAYKLDGQEYFTDDGELKIKKLY